MLFAIGDTIQEIGYFSSPVLYKVIEAPSSHSPGSYGLEVASAIAGNIGDRTIMRIDDVDALFILYQAAPPINPPVVKKTGLPWWGWAIPLAVIGAVVLRKKKVI